MLPSIFDQVLCNLMTCENPGRQVRILYKDRRPSNCGVRFLVRVKALKVAGEVRLSN